MFIVYHPVGKETMKAIKSNKGKCCLLLFSWPPPSLFRPTSILSSSLPCCSHRDCWCRDFLIPSLTPLFQNLFSAHLLLPLFLPPSPVLLLSSRPPTSTPVTASISHSYLSVFTPHPFPFSAAVLPPLSKPIDPFQLFDLWRRSDALRAMGNGLKGCRLKRRNRKGVSSF